MNDVDDSSECYLLTYLFHCCQVRLVAVGHGCDNRCSCHPEDTKLFLRKGSEV